MIDWVSDHQSHSKTLVWSAIVAFTLEMGLLTAVGWHNHWLSHPQKTQKDDESRYIEAQVFEVPAKSHLVEEKKETPPPQRMEKALSKVPGKGKPAEKTSSPIEEENRTESGPKLVPNHGPVAIFAPSPIIPSYLQNRELNTNVVIDFYVNSQGTATPRLVGSSGEEELDAIALETIKKWQFRPAEKDHKPIDAKVRLRITFEVK